MLFVGGLALATHEAATPDAGHLYVTQCCARSLTRGREPNTCVWHTQLPTPHPQRTSGAKLEPVDNKTAAAKARGRRRSGAEESKARGRSRAAAKAPANVRALCVGLLLCGCDVAHVMLRM